MTTMLHLPYGPGIGPGPFTARKGSSSRASLLPGVQLPGSFFEATVMGKQSREMAIRYYYEHREEILDRQRTVERNKRREREKVYRERDREKKLAKNAVYRAVCHGTITKKPCEVCGSDEVQAHHDDYSKPLEVRWLCRRHHSDLHNKIREELRANNEL